MGLPRPRRSETVLATSDFSHYFPDGTTRERDRYALDAIKALDPARFAREVIDRDIRMCGMGPVMAMMVCMGLLGEQ